MGINAVFTQNDAYYGAPNYLTVIADMTSTTWNTVATHEVFTITGMVRIWFCIQCGGTLTDAADGASIQFGNEFVTNAIIASTGAAGAGGNTIAVGEMWIDATPADFSAAETAGILKQVVSGGTDLGYEITGAALTGGSLVFHAWWWPISSNGAVAAGAGGTL